MIKKKKKHKRVNKNPLNYWIDQEVLWDECVCMLSHISQVWLFATLWTMAHQAPSSMGFSRQEYWSGLPCPPPGDLPDPGIEPISLCLLHWQAGFFLPLSPSGNPWNEHIAYNNCSSYFVLCLKIKLQNHVDIGWDLIQRLK